MKRFHHQWCNLCDEESGARCWLVDSYTIGRTNKYMNKINKQIRPNKKITCLASHLNKISGGEGRFFNFF